MPESVAQYAPELVAQYGRNSHLTAIQPFTTTLISSNIKMYKYNWTWIKGNMTGYLNAKKQPLRKTEDVCVFYKKWGTYNPQLLEGKPYTTTRGHMTENYRTHDKVTTTVNSGWRYPHNIIYIPERTTMNHPTEKPVRLFEYLIKTYTNSGDTILDNCAGVCTTAVAAEKLDRNWICIEKEEKYCDIGQLRLDELKQEINNDLEQ